MRRIGLVATATVTTALAIAVGADGASRYGPALLLLAFIAFAVLVVSEVRRPCLRRRDVWIGTTLLLLVAVAVPPQSSKDLWSYASYGRSVSTYHESPYTHTPRDHPQDPINRRVSRGWIGVSSVYGPAFTAVSAIGTAAAGDSPLRVRLFFQGLAAAALLAALAVLHRRGAPAGALAMVGLNPLAAASIVNNGHNDLLIGVAVLLAVLLARERRGAVAGVAVGLACLIKVAAVVPLGALVVWLWRRDRVQGMRAAAAGGGVIVGGYLLAGGVTALRPLQTASRYVSGNSVWHLVRNARGTNTVLPGTLVWGAVALVIMAIAVGWRRRPDPVAVTIAAVLAYLLAAPYALPWYVGWVLPAVALTWRSRLAWLATAYPAVALIVY
ncbi:MAG: alpha,6-mannosyltransferase, partial [Actinomycetota bacterium]|nr:alpha,6-mannosyltransferase [Actinomycetota bacterium]